jgi:hypothetical protein
MKPLLDKRFLWLLFTGVLAVILHSGIWIMPNAFLSYVLSQNLTVLPFTQVQEHYLMNNYLQPALFGLMGGQTFIGYVGYSLFISFLFIMTFAVWFLKKHGEDVALKEYKLLVALCFPVFTIAFYWLGIDSLTLLLMLLTLIFLENYWRYLFAFLLAFQHFEQGIMAFLLLLFSIFIWNGYLYYANNKSVKSYKPVKPVIGVVISLLMGKLILISYFYSLGISLEGDRQSFLENNLEQFLTNWQNYWHYILISLFGIMWLFVLKSLHKLWPLVLVALIVWLLTMFVGDQTRVATIVLFPVVFYWLFADKTIWANFTQKHVILLLIFFIIIPPLIVWGGPNYSLLELDWPLLQHLRSDQPLEQFDLLMPYK